MNNDIKEIIEQRNIKRLCHFTKSKNLPQILMRGRGILASEFIAEDIFDPNDNFRYDGKTKYINCSIQYPNVYYFNKISEKDIQFKEWIILFINPYIMTKEDTYFCKVNAAKENGKYIKKGADALKELFDNRVLKLDRTNKMPTNVPTDLQAEVLIYEQIPVEAIEAIVVPNIEQAHREKTRLETFNLQIPSIYVIPELFDKKLGINIREGKIPKENIYYERSELQPWKII